MSASTQILSDHDHLRVLLERLASAAEDALRDEKHRPRLRDALDQLRDTLERHLVTEERLLVPLLLGADRWGPERVAQLEEEHAGQRALVTALAEDAGEGVRTTDDLVDEIRWFVASLGKEMRDEEATFLNAEAVGEVAFAGEQPRA